jgi:hypothetical protein
VDISIFGKRKCKEGYQLRPTPQVRRLSADLLFLRCPPVDGVGRTRFSASGSIELHGFGNFELANYGFVISVMYKAL